MEKKKKISRIITVRLFIAVFIAFIVSSTVTYAVIYLNCEKKAKELMYATGSKAVTDYRAAVNQEFFRSTCALEFDAWREGGEEGVRKSLEGSNYSYWAKRDGTILISGNEEFIGRNVNDIQYVSACIEGVSELSEKSGTVYYIVPTVSVKTLDGKYDMYYVVAADPQIPDIVSVCAVSPGDYEDVSTIVSDEVFSYLNIGLTGAIVVINNDYAIISRTDSFSDSDRYTEFPKKELLESFDTGTDKRIVTSEVSDAIGGETIVTETKDMYGRDVFWGTDCYFDVSKDVDAGLYYVCLYPAKEALEQANGSIGLILFIEVVVFAVLFIVLRQLIRKNMVNKLDMVNASLAEITSGNLEKKVEVRDTAEFDMLSNDINATVDRLKGYIAEAAARFDADLAIAKAIQTSALPSVFPPFPERKEFELFASMNAAKEVGGDFYDFYMLNDTTLGFLIADVSGKSIPGAMFMMTAKTVIKSLAESGLPPADVFTRANEKLCEGNEAEMFVTAWLGYLDLKTGLVRVANAGHNPPILIHEGRAEYVILKPGLMLAGMDGVGYREQTLQLEKGDMLYLYTDGVTEAMDKDEEQYGEDRLKTLLSFGENTPTPSEKNSVAQPVCEAVIADVLKFTDGADQSDDITMLCVRYLGASDA